MYQSVTEQYPAHLDTYLSRRSDHKHPTMHEAFYFQKLVQCTMYFQRASTFLFPSLQVFPVNCNKWEARALNTVQAVVITGAIRLFGSNTEEDPQYYILTNADVSVSQWVI